jgi:hypothetical protein
MGAQVNLTQSQLETLQHTLGVDQYGRGPKWRNYFVGEDADCEALVGLGYMEKRPGHALLTAGDPVYVVTRTGKTAMVEESPSPPRLTRSQRRYEHYRSLDSTLSFGDYLKWMQRRAVAEREGLLYE